jgi:hypothetical protein
MMVRPKSLGSAPGSMGRVHPATASAAPACSWRSWMCWSQTRPPWAASASAPPSATCARRGRGQAAQCGCALWHCTCSFVNAAKQQSGRAQPAGMPCDFTAVQQVLYGVGRAKATSQPGSKRASLCTLVPPHCPCCTWQRHSRWCGQHFAATQPVTWALWVDSLDA